MINVTYGSNLSRLTTLVNPNTTIRTFCEENGIGYETASMTLDGASLRPGDMDKSFADLGVTERCFLLSVVKADNA